MTRPTGSRLDKKQKNCSLVLDGDDVKLRLEAERIATGSVVHVDWLRFTCLLRNAPLPDVDLLFPPPQSVDERCRIIDSGTNEERNFLRLVDSIRGLTKLEHFAGLESLELARRVCAALGPDFFVCPDLNKGHDFYRYRWSIERNGHEVGNVCFLASSDSKRQKAQANTIHVNLWGSACTFAASGWRERLADLIDDTSGKVTRVDLALDFFDGLEGGIERIKDDYILGLCNVKGKRPGCNMVGDWCNGKGRSFYLGSKQAGKQTNFYEKGFQLFGEKDATNWLRAELRLGNKLRILPSSILRRPQDFFAGASDYHAALLREAEPSLRTSPSPTPCEKRLAEETIEAEVVRNVRWLRNVAAASFASAMEFLDHENLLEILTGVGLPHRLSRFSMAELKQAYHKAFNRTQEAAGAGPAFSPS